MIERSVCSGNAAFCQTTLTTSLCLHIEGCCLHFFKYAIQYFTLFPFVTGASVNSFTAVLLENCEGHLPVKISF